MPRLRRYYRLIFMTCLPWLLPPSLHYAPAGDSAPSTTGAVAVVRGGREAHGSLRLKDSTMARPNGPKQQVMNQHVPGERDESPSQGLRVHLQARNTSDGFLGTF